jgi:hypothetical protein
VQAIVTLRLRDKDVPNSEKTQVLTYERVLSIAIEPDTQYLTIRTEEGDFSFDPLQWASFMIAK